MARLFALPDVVGRYVLPCLDPGDRRSVRLVCRAAWAARSCVLPASRDVELEINGDWLLAGANALFGGNASAALERCVRDGACLSAEEALSYACVCGVPGALDWLAEWPCSLGHQDAIRTHALHTATVHGHEAVFDRLALPPYCATADLKEVYGVLWCTVARDRQSFLDRLIAAPAFVPDTESFQDMALCAARFGSSASLARLAAPPFSLTTADAIACVHMALTYGNDAVVRGLTEPPFGLTRADVQVGWARTAHDARAWEDTELTERLAQSPWAP